MPLAKTRAGSILRGEEALNVLSGLHQDRFHPLPHVVSARAGDTTVLMDRKRGTYHTLNEVSGRIWELLGAGATVLEMIERLLDDYDVTRQQLASDVPAILQRFLNDRLIASDPMPVSTPRAERLSPGPAAQALAGRVELRVPSVVRCGVMLFVVKTMFKVKGFAWTIDWMRRQVEGMPVRTSVDLHVVRATEYQVAMAGSLYPGRALCLEQSLALYYLLRCQGICVQFRMGVQPHPFVAHAWVEYLWKPINDFAEHVKHFAQLPDELP